MSKNQSSEQANSSHPTHDRLLAFSIGEITESEQEQIAEHIAECDHCCTLLALAGQCDPFESRLAKALSKKTSNESAHQVSTSVLRWLVNSISSGVKNDQPDSDAPRQILQYRIIREVARGGMGVIYEAEDANLNRRVAIKMILTGEFSSSEMRVRFRREAELLARTQHPNIIQVFEVGEFRGLPFLAMEWVAGGNLADRIKLHLFDPAEASRLTQRLADAVHSAHVQGIVHRDLKPSNVLLSLRGPLITDFGIAFQYDDDVRLTVSGGFFGTPEYAAPELGVTGLGLPSTATDVYALGVILYEMISGQCPFRGPTGLETLRRATAESVVPLSRHRKEVPRDLDVIVSKCLEKHPVSRYSSAAALAEDLTAFLEGRPISARQTGAMERSWRWCRRSPIIASLVLALCIAIATGSTMSVWFAAIASQNATEADRLAKQSLEIASVARDAQMKAEKAEEMARQRASDAMSVLLETAWNDGDANKFLQYLRNVTDRQQVDQLPFEQRVLANRLNSGHTLLHSGGDAFTSACTTPDGKILLASTVGQGVHAFDLESESFIRSFEPHPNQLNCLTFSKDKTRVLGSDIEGNIVSWDFATGRLLSCKKLHEGELTVIETLFDGRFVTAGKDGSVLILSPEMRLDQVLRKNTSSTTLSVSADGKLMAVASLTGDVEIIDTSKLDSVSSISSPCCMARRLQFSHSGHLLATAGFDGVVSVLQLDPQPVVIASKRMCHGEIVAIKWSTNDSMLAVGSIDQRILLLAPESLSITKTCMGHNGTVSSVEFHGPDDSQLLSCGFDGTIRIWSDRRNPNPERFHWSSNSMSQVVFHGLERPDEVVPQLDFCQF